MHPAKSRRLPSLNALRTFEAAARHLSFKAAAEELSVSQSAISHQIKGLEDQLGLALFARQARGIELTAQGELYYPILREAFDQIAEGTRAVTSSSLVSILTLQVYSTFTSRWLLPRLARFQQEHTDVQVRLTTAQTDANFNYGDIDAAILITQPTDERLDYAHLFNVTMTPVCSASYRDTHGPFASPADLAGAQLIQVYPSREDWQVWLAAHALQEIDCENGLQLESYDLALGSAAQGLGVALGQQPYIERDLASGALVELFPDNAIPNPRSWYLACRKERREQHKIALFREWLLKEVASDSSITTSS